MQLSNQIVSFHGAILREHRNLAVSAVSLIGAYFVTRYY